MKWYSTRERGICISADTLRENIFDSSETGLERWHERFPIYVTVLQCDAVCCCFFDGYCSTVQGLLDWFEVDLGFTELSFIG